MDGGPALTQHCLVYAGIAGVTGPAIQKWAHNKTRLDCAQLFSLPNSQLFECPLTLEEPLSVLSVYLLGCGKLHVTFFHTNRA